MNQILEFLLKYFSFLYQPGRFRFVDSETASSFGGDAFLILASGLLRLRFVRDRGQLLLDFQGTGQPDPKHWYSIDLVQRWLTGEQQSSAELTKEHAKFLEVHIEEIEARFASGQLADTLRALKKLEQIRAQELFG